MVNTGVCVQTVLSFKLLVTKITLVPRCLNMFLNMLFNVRFLLASVATAYTLVITIYLLLEQRFKMMINLIKTNSPSYKLRIERLCLECKGKIISIIQIKELSSLYDAMTSHGLN